jgi:hypothetical protein
MTQKGNWLATQSRPDLACQVSVAQQAMPAPTLGHIRLANALVRRAQQFSEVAITFHSIPVDELRFVLHTDYSSKDRDGTGCTQGGYLIGATTSGLSRGEEVPYGALVWRSYKLRRACASTLAGEAQVLSAGLGHLEWYSCFFCAAVFPTYVLEDRGEYMKLLDLQAVIDCKSVFDHITKAGAPSGIADKRCSIDMAIIRQCLTRMACTLRWAPTGLQLADALTKESPEAADLLRAVLKFGKYQLAGEAKFLERALEEKIEKEKRKAKYVSNSTFTG